MMSAALASKVRIVAGHIAFQPMRLQASLFPDPMHGVFADAQGCGKLATTPVSGTILRLLAGSRENPGSQASESARKPTVRDECVSRPSIPERKKALLPPDDGRRRGPQLLLDRC